jgi:hydrogenase-1 operon protein HyaF
MIDRSTDTHRPLPIGAIGPGTQSSGDDGAELEYLSMPGAMQTYRPPSLPEPDAVADCAAGLALLGSLHRLLSGYRVGALPQVIDLARLATPDQQLVLETLGEGEVSIRGAERRPEATTSVSADGVRAAPERIAQETRLAGVWRVTERAGGMLQRDVLEVCAVPGFVRFSTFADARARIDTEGLSMSELMNAPGVLAELNGALAAREAARIGGRAGHCAGDRTRRRASDRTGERVEHQAGGEREGSGEAASAVDPVVINLTLLPQTEADLACLEERLGLGPVSILSRGYGNCRITATAIRDLWWVQYFNSDDRLILNTLELTEVPAAALAAQEDIDDSAKRLAEILEALK